MTTVASKASGRIGYAGPPVLRSRTQVLVGPEPVTLRSDRCLVSRNGAHLEEIVSGRRTYPSNYGPIVVQPILRTTCEGSGNPLPPTYYSRACVNINGEPARTFKFVSRLGVEYPPLVAATATESLGRWLQWVGEWADGDAGWPHEELIQIPGYRVQIPRLNVGGDYLSPTASGHNRRWPTIPGIPSASGGFPVPGTGLFVEAFPGTFGDGVDVILAGGLAPVWHAVGDSATPNIGYADGRPWWLEIRLTLSPMETELHNSLDVQLGSGASADSPDESLRVVIDLSERVRETRSAVTHVVIACEFSGYARWVKVENIYPPYIAQNTSPAGTIQVNGYDLGIVQMAPLTPNLAREAP